MMPMMEAHCPNCGFGSPIFFGNYLCPKCRHVFVPDGWQQRLHPVLAGARDHRVAAPDRSASTTQTQFACPECGARLPPWALLCTKCGYRI